MGAQRQSPTAFLANLFEFEYCAECGGDADDHNAVPFLGNWFAKCRHPLPDNLSDADAEAEAELEARRERQEAGKPMIGG